MSSKLFYSSYLFSKFLIIVQYYLLQQTRSIFKSNQKHSRIQQKSLLKIDLRNQLLSSQSKLLDSFNGEVILYRQTLNRNSFYRMYHIIEKLTI
jgi:hypothetical protein